VIIREYFTKAHLAIKDEVDILDFTVHLTIYNRGKKIALEGILLYTGNLNPGGV
jgi:hypothetical protein